MGIYEREIPGNLNLKDINTAISDEETGAAEFKSSKVTASSTGTGEPTNTVTFSELGFGTIPKPLTIVEQGATQPRGIEKVWSGAMVVEGRTTAVIAYREE